MRGLSLRISCFLLALLLRYVYFPIRVDIIASCFLSGDDWYTFVMLDLNNAYGWKGLLLSKFGYDLECNNSLYIVLQGDVTHVVHE